MRIIEAYDNMNEKKAVVSVKIIDMTSKNTDISIWDADDEPTDKKLLKLYTQVMKTGDFAEDGQIVAQPLFETVKKD